MLLNRDRIGAALVAVLAATACRAQDTAKAVSSKSPTEPRVLVVSPARPTVPALRYRLLPLESERTPGDAAPVYIRLGAKATKEEKDEISKRSTEWANLPLEKLPLAEVRKFVGQWDKTLEQLDFGARRQSCDWSYTLSEQKLDVIEILMPDAQDMRNWVRLEQIKARLEIAGHRYADAVRTIETGIAFGRHAGQGPFVINGLVGVACAQVMLSCLDDLVAQGDAPNLYWSLTALPRPLVSLRHSLESEELMPEWLFPELTEVGRPHTDGEWSAILARLFARMKALEAKIMVSEGAAEPPHPIQPKLGDLADYKARALPEARKYVKAERTMPDDQIVLTYIAGKYREIYDDQFKGAYLPYPEGFAATTESQKRLESYKNGVLDLFMQLIPSVPSVIRAEARLDRAVAARRVIEALRLHAAEAGKLPRSLDEVTAVPVPLDPLTGKPFEYRLDGDTAVLVGLSTIPADVLTYRVSLRKP